MILSAWRITKATHAPDAFSGEGAWRFGGRWNSLGKRVVYTAEHASLAVLEVLVHLESSLPLAAYSLIQAEFDEVQVERLVASKLPEEWRRGPAPAEAQLIGDRWIEEGRSLVLGVPSAILPIETVYLINPEHPSFEDISFHKPQPFSFDERLMG
jgi:RES domain-containing protein